MGTLLNSADRSAMVERLRRVRPESKAAWGSLDAARMLCHVADQMRVALGEIPTKPQTSFIRRTLVKTIVANTGMKPPRGKIETAPEMLSSRPGSWDADLSACVVLMERVAKGTANAPHPAFGALTPEEWGRVCWKDLDHHLRQFGA